MKALDTPLGARVPKGLKKKLDHFCRQHGLKMTFVVTAALEDKLGELEEELKDRKLAWQRLKDAEFVSQEEYDRYMKHRFSNR